MAGNNIDKTIYTGSSMSGSIEGRNNNSNPLGSYYRNNRVNLLTKEVAADFNTYRNWKEFRLVLPKIWDDEGKLTNVHHPQGYGTKSLFSNNSAVYSKSATGDEIRDDMNMPLLDSPESRAKIRNKTGCTVKELVDASAAGLMGRAIYNYSDFMYCKYLGRIPNNYLITLRKFPMPCSDHINFSFLGESKYNQHLPDMGRLVTWLGTPGNEMSNLLSYTYSMSWSELSAPVEQKPEAIGGRDGGSGMAGMLGVLDGTYGKEVAASGGYGYSNETNIFARKLGFSGEGIARNADLANQNRMFESNQNAIMKVKVPGSKDTGLSFGQSITLTFDYELRSYDGVNGRSAMLDLLANILMVTYTQGKFFPGSYRSANMATSNIYTNLPIFKQGVNATLGTTLSNMFESFKQIAIGLGFGPGKNPIQALKDIGNNIMTLMCNGLINKLGRPQQFAYTSLISPTPTGQWHLMIGNPRNPIMSIGNLCLTSAKIEHYGPLGLDDFPTGLKVTVTLEHAKARDSVAIEQMYMQGNNRIYTPMGADGIRNMYEGADVVKDMQNTNRTDNSTPADKVELNNNIISSATSAGVIKKNNSIYMKYMGTTDIQNVSIMAAEALTGSNKTTKNKNNKK